MRDSVNLPRRAYFGLLSRDWPHPRPRRRERLRKTPKGGAGLFARGEFAISDNKPRRPSPLRAVITKCLPQPAAIALDERLNISLRARAEYLQSKTPCWHRKQLSFEGATA